MNPISDNSTAQPVVAQADVNDDLAKALASVQAGPQAQDAMQFENVGEPAMSEVPAAPPVPAEPVTPTPTATPAPSPAPTLQSDVDDAVDATDVPVAPQAPAPEFSTPSASIDHTGATEAPEDSIEQIKVSALQQLRPLMQHIELSPEEKFEKYLMMLRASDDVSLIEPTYQAAQQISSEKLKAQALLDVINEINYLTSQQLVD